MIAALAVASLVFIAGATLAGLIWLAARREPTSEVLWFSGAVGLGTVWVAAVGANAVVGDPSITGWIQVVELAAGSLASLVWLGFMLSYVGRHDWLNAPAFVVLTMVPAATVGVLLSEQFYGLGLVRADDFIVAVGGLELSGYRYGPWGLIQLVYSYLLVAMATALGLDLAVSHRRPYREQGYVLALAGLVPLVTSVSHLLGLQTIDGLDPTPLSLAAVGLTLGIGLLRLDLLVDVPTPTHVAHEAVLESLDSPLVVVSTTGAIRHANRAVRILVDRPPESLVDTPAGELPGVTVAEDGHLEIDDRIEIETVRGRRTYHLSRTPLTDDRDRRYGTILLYQDATDIHLREERLNVLNRVLRHDIRNEMTVVLGHARDGRDAHPDATDHFDAIEETARSVVHTADTARQIERLLPREAVHAEGSLGGAMQRVHDRLRRHHGDVHLETALEIPPGTAVPAGFTPVVWHLVDNAALHTPAEADTVAVRVGRTDDGWLRVTVTDEGTGIPPDELAVFEQGRVTQLDHASGLGLWLVHWVTGEYGGTIDVDTGAEGTTIAVTLPEP